MSVALRTIKEVQGDKLNSPLVGEIVRLRGKVTAVLRRGFFIQTPNVRWDGKASDGIFVYSPNWKPEPDAMLEVQGEVADYLKHDLAKPVTQIRFDQVRLLKDDDEQGNRYAVEPVEFTKQFLPKENQKLAVLLNSLEGMLIKIGVGQTFIAPSNPHGDYVLALDADKQDLSVTRSSEKGALVSSENPLRWFPGFRVANYNHAPRLNVGAKLQSDIVGPLNYRADSYQLAVQQPFKFEPAYIEIKKSTLEPSVGSITIMTLNCFNLDPKIEAARLVMNPKQDVDDDWGEGRFHTLAQAIALQANIPDVIALQEIQDSDGAEITEVVDASKTYACLIETIEELSGVRYQWTDVAPLLGEDGGQPGGNIRNAYLYNPERVHLVPDSIRVIGHAASCFVDSRKPLLAKFTETASDKEIVLINVHLASKRHQRSIFSPSEAGQDGKLSVRVAQAKMVAAEIEKLQVNNTMYYVTGDFNDTEYSQTLIELLGQHSVNLVCTLSENERFDYNHRGKLQVLMHGIVSKNLPSQYTQYEIIHGNELIGVTPGEESDKPSDHAYVLAKLRLT